MTDTFRIGKSVLTNRGFWVRWDALFSTHTDVIGSTGQGKSKFLQIPAQNIIDQGHVFILIDGKGDLYDTMCRYCAEKLIMADRVVLIDPADTKEYVPGYNPIMLDGREPFSRARMVLDAFMKLFREDEETKPWLRDYMLHSLVPLEVCGLGILELEPFLQDANFRSLVVDKAGISRIKRFWNAFSELSKQEQEKRIGAALTRASLLWSSGEGLKRILGQLVDTIDWKRLFERKGICLVNASPSAGIDREGAWFLGTILLQKMIEVATSRGKGEREPVFIMVDECQRFASADFVDALATLRGFGVHLILAHQDLEQLRKIEGMYSAVMSNCQNRVVFPVSAEDAEILEAELFTGYRGERELIHERTRRAFEPQQEWKDVKTKGVTHQPEVTSTTHTDERIIETEVTGRTEHPATTSQTLRDGGFFEGEQETSHQYSDGYTVDSSSRSTQIIPAQDTEHTTPAHDVTSESVTPQFLTVMKEYEEIADQQIESLQDMKERCKAWIVKRDPRNMWIKLGQRRPYPIMVQWTEDPPVSDFTLQAWKKLIYRYYPKGDDVDREIESRSQKLLDFYEQSHTFKPYEEVTAPEKIPSTKAKKERRGTQPHKPRRKDT